MIPGEVFEGKYRIVKILGKGGMSTVYLAENMNLGTFWAIKEVYKSNASHINALVEPNILKKLHHPALPRIYDIVEDQEKIYIIVDFIEGVPLSQELERVGKFDEETVLKWASQICEVLLYLHSQKPNPIIYRDMKPSNIILTGEGTLKLIDFGIAREYKDGADNDTVYIGTRGYAAPEQYSGGQTNARTDIYSLGVTLCHLVTGISPWVSSVDLQGAPKGEFRFSEELEYIIQKCTKQNPEQRYPSVKELQADIKRILEGRPQGNACNNYSSQYNAPAHCFRKLFLAIRGSTEFACELAYVISKAATFKVLLINLDFPKGFVDIYLGLRSGIKPGVLQKCLDTCSAGNSWLQELLTVNRFLSVLSDTTGALVYQKYKDKTIEMTNLFRSSYNLFDIVICSLGEGSEYEEEAIRESTHCIFVLRGSTDAIRAAKQDFEYLNSRKIMDESKFRAAIIEYKPGINISRNVLKALYGENFLGCLQYNEARERFRDAEEACYVREVHRILKHQYSEILQNLGIMQKENPWSRWFGNIWGRVAGKERSEREVL